MGLELTARRQGDRVSGWVTYTLSRSSRLLPCGLRERVVDPGVVVGDAGFEVFGFVDERDGVAHGGFTCGEGGGSDAEAHHL